MHVALRATTSAAVFLLRMCADPLPPSVPPPPPSPPAVVDAVDPNELIGEAMEWPHGRPTLRTELHTNLRFKDRNDDGTGEGIYYAVPPQERWGQTKRPEQRVISYTTEEMRAYRKAEAMRQMSDLERVFEETLGLDAAEVGRCFRAEKSLLALAPDVLRHRIGGLCTYLDKPSAKSVVLGAPRLLLHANLRHTLPEKLRELCDVTGLPAERIALSAPTLIGLDAAKVRARFDSLVAALPGIDVLAIVQRAPRLLCRNPAAAGEAFAQLRGMLPEGADVEKVLFLQPTLLLVNNQRLGGKIELLRELCTDAEWEALLQSGSFARALTTSLEVIGRLRDAPAPADGSPRPVVSILLMSKRKYEAANGRKAPPTATPRRRRKRKES